jgi:Na+-transporting NADH:ubiquinone oxidoreductase subunit A
LKGKAVMIRIRKGLNLPIQGEPKQEILDAGPVSKVAIIGDDYVGMKPSMKVKVGDSVKMGTPLFYDKKNEQVVYTSPAAGRVIEINRGERRIFQSVVIEVTGDEAQSFSNYKSADANSYSAQDLTNLLVEAGEWPAFRTRPYSKVPAPGSKPHSIFITAMDTNPLTADANVIIAANAAIFKLGLEAISKLTDGKVFVCTDKNFNQELPSNVQKEVFQGPHPAGNAGTHIHYLDPVSLNKTVWTIGYQDVIAIGGLIQTGKIHNQRIVSLAGPQVSDPKLYRTIRGACLCQLTNGKTKDGENRVISGSVFSGHTANPGPFCYLGRYHNQVTVLKEGNFREFLGWNSPGVNKFSIKNIYLSKFMPTKKFAFTTNTNGSLRSIVPIGSFEKVMPLDIQPTFLLRSLMSKNTEKAKQLGCLELAEEDLALCTFVDPCKNEYGPVLRENLTQIEKDG